MPIVATFIRLPLVRDTIENSVSLIAIRNTSVKQLLGMWLDFIWT